MSAVARANRPAEQRDATDNANRLLAVVGPGRQLRKNKQLHEARPEKNTGRVAPAVAAGRFAGWTHTPGMPAGIRRARTVQPPRDDRIPRGFEATRDRVFATIVINLEHDTFLIEFCGVTPADGIE
jgi:hypothetical protein